MIGDEMRIHSDILAGSDFLNAERIAGVTLVNFDSVGSRSRVGSFEFSLTGSSNHAANFGGGYKAATWDEWGIFLAHLFSVDPQAHCGKQSYLSAEHFHWSTGNRFDSLTLAGQHKRHAWGMGQRCVTGSYSVSQCDCGAVQRWILRPHTWEEISS
jgi:hypothetical protein